MTVVELAAIAKDKYKKMLVKAGELSDEEKKKLLGELQEIISAYVESI